MCPSLSYLFAPVQDRHPLEHRPEATQPCVALRREIVRESLPTLICEGHAVGFIICAGGVIGCVVLLRRQRRARLVPPLLLGTAFGVGLWMGPLGRIVLP